jgi:hypothetical protein
MKKKLLILDLDGVANDHKKLPNGYCTLYPDKIELINEIVRQTDCKLVISSAWRYMILNKWMTLDGFKAMLMTYGLEKLVFIVDCIDKDVNIEDNADRAKNVKKWLFQHHNFEDYLIVDDLDLGFTEHKLKFYQTKGNVGLTVEDVANIVKLLNGV